MEISRKEADRLIKLGATEIHDMQGGDHLLLYNHLLTIKDDPDADEKEALKAEEASREDL